MSTQLATPTITLSIEDKTTIRISGLAVAHAQGYQVKIATLAGGGVAQKVSPTDGVVTLTGRSPRSLYFVSARALGDDENYTNSDWSAEQTIQTGTDVDQSLTVPNIGAAAESFTTIAISGLTAYKEYRFQVATTSAGLDNAVPRIIGSGDGTAKIMGLEPGTAYFIRACLVEGAKCSLWSDVVSAATDAVTNTIEVTDGGNTGAGTLRQAVADAVDGTKIVLKVSSVTLNTVINSTKRMMIVGGLDARTVISPGNNNVIFTAAYSDFRHIKLTGSSGATLVLNSASRLDDCVIDGVQTTSANGYLSTASIYQSTVQNNYSGSGGLVNCRVYDCVISNNTARNSNAAGGGMRTGEASNCLLTGNTSGNYGGGASAATLTKCELTGNTAANGGGAYTGTLVDCTLSGNTASVTGGGTNGSTLTGCTLTGNTASNGGGAYAGTVTGCVITGNTAANGGGVNGGTGLAIDTCLVYSNTKLDQTPDDFYHTTNAACTLRSSTIGIVYHNKPTYIEMYNTLYQALSEAPTAGNANNLCYDGLEDDYFVDAANGDYRLKYGALAIDAGDNQYVQATRDLAGNPRIGGTKVDVGAYEFEPYKLPAPDFEITVLPGGQATISYSLPPLASGFCLQYADNDAFLRPHEISSTAIAIDLSGLTGQVYFRAKALGTEGQSLDSDWSETGEGYFDITAPVIIVDQTPIEMVYGQTVDFLADVTITDDMTGDLTVHYQVIDINGDPVEVDGTSTDIRSSGIPKGSYTLHITAADVAGNVGTADRALTVLPPRLPAPDITLKGIQGTTAIISGLLNSSAIGWMMSVDGEEKSVIPNEGGQVILANLTSNTTHLVKAKALGDWIQPPAPEPPSGDYRDSNWSATLSITIGGDTPAGTPSIAKAAITDHTLVLAVSGVSEDISYLEILLATNPAFVDPVLVTKVSKPEIVIDGLKASQIYFVRARGYYGAEPTAFSSTLVVETLPIQSTSPADKLAYIRARIALLRDYLAEVGNLSTISIDGISESRVDRASIRAELAELEAEESRLAGGGGRLRTIDARWVI